MKPQVCRLTDSNITHSYFKVPYLPPNPLIHNLGKGLQQFRVQGLLYEASEHIHEGLADVCGHGVDPRLAQVQTPLQQLRDCLCVLRGGRKSGDVLLVQLLDHFGD